ncbi:Asd/ArgC dimerization domain-containing protein [Chitinilyticum piscinae]|uniref:Semialdehyde dehydrogenase dimerisation domain-containing protein n=1 Tax=Chitinilyticum piscinae TaxID=2866724 RepID=A0A8J7FZS0_9NEIS|nr:Asd/ArgC dimerization domain-containing protein [Chitinilyticum piscinae]MBE9609335.1 hypothetical protein [Chitinilyticum piscinae]
MAGLKVALIGATPTFLELLADSGLVISALYPLAAQDDGSLLEHGDDVWPVIGLDDFDFADVDLLLCLADPELAQAAIPQALAAGLTVLDASNAGVAAGDKGRLLSLPHIAALQLARPLQSLAAAGGIEAASASVFLPVSASGQAGVDELSAQVRSLFAHGDISSKVFAKRIAFNLLPDFSAALRGGIASQLGKMTEGLQLDTLQLIHMPVFYGMSASLTMRLKSAMSDAEVRAALAANEGLLVLPEGQLVATQDVIGADKVWVGDVALSADGRTLQLWLLADNSRLQAMTVLAVLLQLAASRH